ncbi:glycosyltransferase [Gilvimarinus sp. SDUM040013]|uniref:Glycosyltransferase n=1 Tax=Gilvimarinus gilvus TaxID=3058038 RepID=A0ABU4RW00_9GAMM|nr:glycosyltransferase [Gilvimarinus sp. SDUM040013]MDO3387348.1 glycosyltransferase [Gilvimarinus sp. SDUM040013]MDX6849037.1 glycosyltransferase [Gilvimarinus sp. SDUM040013]
MGDSGGRLAITLHIYYLDIAERLLSQLGWLATSDRFALWITVPTEKRADVEALLARHGLVAQVRDYPNTGMDVLPFLRVLPELAEAGYSAVVKLHTKRGADDASAVWGKALLEDMCREPVMSAIDRAFGHYPDLDIVGLAPFFLSARKLIRDDESLVRSLSSEIPNLNIPSMDWGYFAGTMFAARVEPLLPIAAWATDNSHRFSSSYQADGLWTHAVERAFGVMVRQDGLSVGLIHAPPGNEQHSLQRVRMGEAINQAYSRELALQVESFEQDFEALVQCDLLDADNYPLEGEVVGSVDLYRHYLLIGQFDHRVSASKAWRLKRQNDWQMPWDRWQVAHRAPDLVSIIVPIYNQPELTEQCIRSLFSVTTTVCFEVVCLDNGSDATTGAMLTRLAHEFPALRLMRHETNLNFALGCNTGFGESLGARVVFLNNDTTVTDGWLDRLMARLDVGDCFAVQPQLRYPDGTLQCMGVVFSDKSTLGYPIYAQMAPSDCAANKPRKFKALTAACLALNATDFAGMKGFDALYINGQEDVDLCLRLHEHTGKLGAYVPDSVVVHHESKTQGRFKQVDQNRAVFVNRWKGKVATDDLAHYQEDGFTVTGWRSDGNSREAAYRIYRPVLEVMSLIRSANQAFRVGDYARAGEFYAQLAFERPGYPGLEGNFVALRRAWLNRNDVIADRPKVGVCGWSLDHQAAGRAIALAEAYAPLSDVALIGCLPPRPGVTLWPPMQEMSIPCHYFSMHSEEAFVRQAFSLVVQHPFDVVHLSKPRIHNVIMGWLYQLVWGARVIMDVDDEELAFVGADSPLDPASYLQAKGRLPPLRSLREAEWTRLAVGMIGQFDAVTVSNVALKKRYGGQIIPHVRPSARFSPSAAQTAASREEFGIPQDKTVFLFYGSPRVHKGVVETAEVLASLPQKNICYVIAGGDPDQETRDGLARLKGLDIRWLDSQPYERTADIVAMGDACVLLQDADNPVSRFQFPAKLVDALGMGLTVFAQVTPPLEDLAAKGAFIPVTRDNLKGRLQQWLASGDQSHRQKGRAVFKAELTVEAVAPIIGSIVKESSLRRARALRWGEQLARLTTGQLPAGVPLPND